MSPELENEQSTQVQPYQVVLPAFEGPLDLLLHLIKENEINIYDIPVALITAQYLEYLNLMESLNLNVVGDFLVMASTLVHIKSKMLLPVEDQPEEEVLEDPRTDLVNRLLEYQRFKGAAEDLGTREEFWREVFSREGESPIEEEVEYTLVDISLFDLIGALQKVLTRTPHETVMEIMPEKLSVREQMTMILGRFGNEKMLSFDSLFEGERTRLSVITIFLAILELIRLHLIGVQQVRVFEAIWLLKITEDEGDPESLLEARVGDESF